MHRLDKIRPLQPSRQHPALDLKTQAKIKYSMLVQIIKHKPKTKQPFSFEIAAVNPKQVKNEPFNEN